MKGVFSGRSGTWCGLATNVDIHLAVGSRWRGLLEKTLGFKKNDAGRVHDMIGEMGGIPGVGRSIGMFNNIPLGATTHD